jgi:SAM-dependent methyltransferase
MGWLYHPFRGQHPPAEQLGWEQDRFAWTAAILRKEWRPEWDRVLDIGVRTPCTDYLAQRLPRILIAQTAGDLDREAVWPIDRYPCIWCFEVLEHLWNPLWLLDQIHQRLSPGGRVFLSTPSGAQLDWSYCHTVEHALDRLLAMITKAGFLVERQYRFRQWTDYLGVRPPLRWLLRRICFGEYGRTNLYILARQEGQK